MHYIYETPEIIEQLQRDIEAERWKRVHTDTMKLLALRALLEHEPAKPTLVRMQ